MTYGERLQGWREFRGYSRNDLAAKLKVSRQTILGWEKGRWRPSEEREAQIAEVLGIPRSAPMPAFPDPPRTKAA